MRVVLPNERFDACSSVLAADSRRGLLELPGRLDEARRELDEYFAGRRREFDLELDWRLITGFYSCKVLRATAKLPSARRSPTARRPTGPATRANRAAGNALGSNPIPLIVPCHRVCSPEVGLAITGGPEMKECHLNLEGAIGCYERRCSALE